MTSTGILGDLITYVNISRIGIKRNEILREGEYKVYPFNNTYTNNGELEGGKVYIKAFGDCKSYYIPNNQRFNVKKASLGFVFESKCSDLKTEYINLWLNLNNSLIQSIKRGSCIQVLYKRDFNNIEITYPSIDTQERIIRESNNMSNELHNFLESFNSVNEQNTIINEYNNLSDDYITYMIN